MFFVVVFFVFFFFFAQATDFKHVFVLFDVTFVGSVVTGCCLAVFCVVEISASCWYCKTTEGNGLNHSTAMLFIQRHQQHARSFIFNLLSRFAQN